MNVDVKLKDYINLSLLKSYRNLNDDELSPQERTNEIIKIQVLEDIDKICQSRRRY